MKVGTQADGTNESRTEIEITPEMIQAGVLEAREHCLGETLAELVSKVYLAMVLEQATPLDRADDGWEARIRAAVETSNNSYWADAKKQGAAFVEWSSNGQKGDCPQISNGSIVDYITRSICFMLAAAPSPLVQSGEGKNDQRLCDRLRAGHQYSGVVEPLELEAADRIATLTQALAEAEKVIAELLPIASEICRPEIIFRTRAFLERDKPKGEMK